MGSPYHSLDLCDLLEFLLNQVTAPIAVKYRDQPLLACKLNYRIGHARTFKRYHVLYSGPQEEDDVSSTLDKIDKIRSINAGSRGQVLSTVADYSCILG